MLRTLTMTQIGGLYIVYMDCFVKKVTCRARELLRSLYSPSFREQTFSETGGSKVAALPPGRGRIPCLTPPTAHPVAGLTKQTLQLCVTYCCDLICPVCPV